MPSLWNKSLIVTIFKNSSKVRVFQSATVFGVEEAVVVEDTHPMRGITRVSARILTDKFF